MPQALLWMKFWFDCIPTFVASQWLLESCKTASKTLYQRIQDLPIDVNFDQRNLKLCISKVHASRSLGTRGLAVLRKYWEVSYSCDTCLFVCVDAFKEGGWLMIIADRWSCPSKCYQKFNSHPGASDRYCKATNSSISHLFAPSRIFIPFIILWLFFWVWLYLLISTWSLKNISIGEISV